MLTKQDLIFPGMWAGASVSGEGGLLLSACARVQLRLKKEVASSNGWYLLPRTLRSL